jgi:hypothetical protein
MCFRKTRGFAPNGARNKIFQPVVVAYKHLAPNGAKTTTCKIRLIVRRTLETAH